MKHFEHGIAHLHSGLVVRQILFEQHRYIGMLQVQFQAGLKPLAQGFQWLDAAIVFQTSVIHLDSGMDGRSKRQGDADPLRAVYFRRTENDTSANS